MGGTEKEPSWCEKERHRKASERSTVQAYDDDPGTGPRKLTLLRDLARTVTLRQTLVPIESAFVPVEFGFVIK